MAHTYNASTGRLRQGGLQVQGQPKLLSEAVSENQQKEKPGFLRGGRIDDTLKRVGGGIDGILTIVGRH